MKRKVFIGLPIMFLLLLSVRVYAQGYVFGPNVRVSDYPPGSAYAYTPNAGQRGVAVRGDTVYCVWDDNRTGDWGVWFTKSTDGGETFLSNVQVNDGLPRAYTPTITVGNDGTIYVTWDDRRPPFDYIQVYFSKSTDGGLTFTPDVLVNDTAGGLKDRPHMDPSMSVDSAGIINIAFDDGRNGPGNYDIYFSKSTDGGGTFTQDVMVNDTVPGDTLDDTRPSLALSDDGDIYVSWSKEYDSLFVSKSTDGGISFSSDVLVNDTVSSSWQNSMDVDSRGYVHVLWRDDRDVPNANIYYSRSTDAGITFSPNIRVNDSILEFRPQRYPSMCVDESGMVYAVWEDGPATYPDIYFTLSIDTGDSAFVQPNVKVTDIPPDSGMFRPSLTVDAGKVYVLWMDFRNNFWSPDVYFARGWYEPGVKECKDKKSKINIFSPFPNPFSDKTVIEFRSSGVESSTPINLKVYDVSGRLIKTLINKSESSRIYRVRWGGCDDKGERVSSGFYFIKGKVGSKEINEKIIYIK